MRLASFCVLVLGGLWAGRPAAARTQVLKTQAGSVVHWAAPEITVGVDSATAPAHLDRLDILLAVERAGRVWNRIPADQPSFRLIGSGTPDVSIRFCRGGWQGDTIDLGRTQFEASPEDGRVSAATVEINTCDHRFTVADDRTRERYSLEAVVRHELGHVLGLGHADDRAAVMYPSGQGTAARVPTDGDETALAVIYLGRDRPYSAQVPSPTTAPEPRPARSATAPEPAPAPPTAPADSVSQLDVTGGDGRALTVFTCEPTLLPPMTDTSERAKHPAGGAPGHSRRRAR